MGIGLKYISDFPSEQAEAIQNKLKDLDNQGKLLDYFKKTISKLRSRKQFSQLYQRQLGERW